MVGLSSRVFARVTFVGPWILLGLNRCGFLGGRVTKGTLGIY